MMKVKNKTNLFLGIGIIFFALLALLWLFGAHYPSYGEVDALFFAMAVFVVFLITAVGAAYVFTSLKFKR